MSISHHYEVVIIGGTLSATVAAALLARRRFRGLLVDQGELAGAAGLLDFVPDDHGSDVITHVHEELGLTDRLSRHTNPISPSIQIIDPDERFDLGHERSPFLDEVGRARGEKAADDLRQALSLLDALEETTGNFLLDAPPLPATGIFDRRAASAAAKKHHDALETVDGHELLTGADRSMRQLVHALLPFVTHLDARSADDIPVSRLARPLLRFLRGLRVLDDAASIRAAMVGVAEDAGFEIIRGVVEHIEPRGKQLDVTIAEERREFSTDVVIDASADLSGLETLPLKPRQKRLASTLEVSRAKGHLHALRLEVDRVVRPAPLAPQALLLNGRRQTRDSDSAEPEDRPILLTTANADDPDRVVLVARHPVSEIESHGDGVDSLDVVIRARLRRLIPFLEDGNPSSSRTPVATHPLYDPELDPIAGISGVPTVTPIKSLLIAGPAVLPGLGVEGQYLAALQATEQLDKQLRKVKRPRLLRQRLATQQ